VSSPRSASAFRQMMAAPTALPTSL
jgi:hypothetical protein